MKSVRKRSALCKALTDIVRQHFFPKGPAELFKIHGVHFQFALFRRDDNPLNIFFYRNQGACLNVIITSVGDQIFNQFSGSGKALNFIKNNQRLPLIKLHSVFQRQQHKQFVQIILVFPKIFQYRIRCLREINEKIGFILFFRKFFHNR